MIKKLFAILTVFAVALGIAGCNLQNDVLHQPDNSTAASTTEQETKIYNHFKDRLPEFEFDNELNAKYKESLSYSFSVKCSEREFKKYVSALEKDGFNQNAVSAQGYYTASTADSYFVEAAHINGILNVNIKKI